MKLSSFSVRTVSRKRSNAAMTVSSRAMRVVSDGGQLAGRALLPGRGTSSRDCASRRPHCATQCTASAIASVA